MPQLEHLDGSGGEDRPFFANSHGLSSRAMWRLNMQLNITDLETYHVTWLRCPASSAGVDVYMYHSFVIIIIIIMVIVVFLAVILYGLGVGRGCRCCIYADGRHWIREVVFGGRLFFPTDSETDFKVACLFVCFLCQQFKMILFEAPFDSCRLSYIFLDCWERKKWNYYWYYIYFVCLHKLEWP